MCVSDRSRVRNSVAKVRSFPTLPLADELDGCSTLVCSVAFTASRSRPSFRADFDFSSTAHPNPGGFAADGLPGPQKPRRSQSSAAISLRWLLSCFSVPVPSVADCRVHYRMRGCTQHAEVKRPLIVQRPSPHCREWVSLAPPTTSLAISFQRGNPEVHWSSERRLMTARSKPDMWAADRTGVASGCSIWAAPVTDHSTCH
jgi:hypothetical protein